MIVCLFPKHKPDTSIFTSNVCIPPKMAQFVCFSPRDFLIVFTRPVLPLNMTLCIVALLTHYLTCLALFFLPLDPVYFFTNLFLLQISSAPFSPLAIGLNSITQCFHWMFNILTYCNHKFTVYQFLTFLLSFKLQLLSVFIGSWRH